MWVLFLRKQTNGRSCCGCKGTRTDNLGGAGMGVGASGVPAGAGDFAIRIFDGSGKRGAMTRVAKAR